MKMKKVLLPFIAGALALSLAACSEEDKSAKDEPTKGETKQEVSKEQNESAEEMQAKLAEQQVDKDKIVAVVNDEKLTGEDYNVALSSIQGQMQQMGQDPTSKETAEQVKAQTLETLVNQALILQKAKEADITASATEIDEEYSAIKKQFGGDKGMKEALESQNLDAKTVKERIADLILFEKYLDKVAPAKKVTDKEIKEYYDQAASAQKGAGQELPPLKELSKEIEGIIKQEQQQELFAAHVKELKAAAKIELKL